MLKKKVALHSLGCRVNQNEAEALLHIFRKADYEVVSFEEKSDVYIIHTCTVTHFGDKKSRNIIRKAIRTNPDALIVVTGCYAQVSPEEVLAIPGVDLVLGTQERSKIIEYVDQIYADRQKINAVKDILKTRDFEELPLEEVGTVRAFLKIQEGCQNFCTYCIIPFARGPVRSRDPFKTIREVEQLVAKGYKEVVLTGIHTGAYGEDLGAPYNLNWLLRELVKIEGLLRLRIGSLDPNEFTPELIETLSSSSKICPHFHISLQSGDDKILLDMRRKYTSADFRNLVKKLKEKLPEVNLTTDVMVGFPGETEEEHENSLAFVEEIAFTGLHVFKYSPRKGTKAASFGGQIANEVKEKRSQEMISLGKALQEKYATGFIGLEQEILVEQLQNEMWEGHTPNFLKVRFLDTISQGKDLKGKLVKVKIKNYVEDYLQGDLLTILD